MDKTQIESQGHRVYGNIDEMAMGRPHSQIGSQQMETKNPRMNTKRANKKHRKISEKMTA